MSPELVRLRRTEGLSAAAAAVLDRAAGFDAEMGFGPPLRADPLTDADTVLEIDTCLHRHDVGHPEDYVLAAVVVVREIRPGTAVVELVVDPERRSIGVATAVVEALGTDPSQGWVDTGARALRASAYGSHPAAERLARRFGVGSSGVRHHLVLPAEDRPTPGPAPVVRDRLPGEPPTPPRFGGDLGEPDRAAVVLGFDAGFARVVRADRQGLHEHTARPAAILGLEVPGGPPGTRRNAAGRVIAGSVGWLREQGGRSVEALVDGADEDVLEAFRAHRFEHDRSDLTFRIPRAPA
ncbi:hypothetical protein [Pseudonocardia xishanensis]|uniref:hypothetical protein n=1 Tax=Pseudonocardia xishanensis TaxID=630995 RepID=UPI0031EE4098